MKKFLMVCALGMLLSAPVFATVIGGNDTKAVPDGTTITLNLPKFNGSISDLTNIWVELKFDIFNAVVEMDNDSAAIGTGTAKLNSSLTTLTSTVNLLKDNFDSINAGDYIIAASEGFTLSATTGDTIGAFNATSGNDYKFHDFGTITKQDSGNIFNGVWANYVGTGDFQITIVANYLTGATFTGSDGYFQGSTPSGEIYAEVVYTYVPEPATILIFAIGSLISIRKKLR